MLKVLPLEEGEGVPEGEADEKFGRLLKTSWLFEAAQIFSEVHLTRHGMFDLSLKIEMNKISPFFCLTPSFQKTYIFRKIRCLCVK